MRTVLLAPECWHIIRGLGEGGPSSSGAEPGQASRVSSVPQATGAQGRGHSMSKSKEAGGI